MFAGGKKIKEYFGLAKPFNFPVAIAFLLSFCFLLVIVIFAGAYSLTGGMAIGTMRFYFFLYMFVAILAAAALSRVSLVSYFMLAWCLIELGLAFSTVNYHSMGLEAPLLPDNDFTPRPDFRFKYHALLQVVPKTNWHSSSGVKVTHNSLGIRGVEPTAEDWKKDMIFVYGGSTTYDLGVDQGKTWPELLQKALHDAYWVVNLGVPGYSSSENLIQTVFYQGDFGPRKPTCAIYYLGWNDVHTAYIQNLDRAYADFHLLYQSQIQSVRQPDIWAANYSPTVRIINGLLKRRFDSLPEGPSPFKRTAVTGRDARFEEIFSEHIRSISAINRSREITTVFMGQLLNRDLMSGAEERSWWTPFLKREDTWSYQEHINKLLETDAHANGDGYIDAGIENFHDADFVDDGHFSAAGAEKFARLISKRVDIYCGKGNTR